MRAHPIDWLVGRNLREIRDGQNLAVDDVAARARVHPTLLEGWEQGCHAPASALFTLAQTLEVPVTELWKDLLPLPED